MKKSIILEVIISIALTGCGSGYQPDQGDSRQSGIKTAQATLPRPDVRTDMPVTLETHILTERTPSPVPSPETVANNSDINPTSFGDPPTGTIISTKTSQTQDEPVDPLAGTDTSIYLIDEHFENTAGWDQFDNKYSRGAIENGHYSLTIKGAGLWSWVLHGPRGASFFYQGTVTVKDCKARDNYGLLFRANNDGSFILFSVSCDGNYQLVRSIKGTFEDIIPWTASDAVNKHNYMQVAGAEDGLTLREEPSLNADVIHFAKNHEVFKVTDGPRYTDGVTWWLLNDHTHVTRSGWSADQYLRNTRTNVLGVRAEGNRFNLYLNGEYLELAMDETFTGGEFGIYASSQATSGLQVIFDDLTVYPVIGRGVPLAPSPSANYEIES